MFSRHHFYRLFPVICSFAALILVILALVAGNKPGVLDGYDIITVNTSSLGNNLADKIASRTRLPTRTTSGDCGGLGPLLGQACDSMTSAAANAMGKPGSEEGDTSNDTGNNGSGNVGNSITGNVADKIHVPDFYSLYALAVCEGNFSEDGTRSLTKCHPYFSGSDVSTIPSLLSTTLNLTVGTLNLNVSPADLGLTYAVESTLDGLNTLLKAFTVIFSIGIGFTGLSFLSSIPAIALGTDTVRMAYPWGVWTNLVFVSTAVFFLVLGGLVAAAGAKVAEGRINDLGDKIGLAAVAGKDWVTLAWAGVALMVVVLLYWVWRAVRLRRAGRMPGDGHHEEEQKAPPPPFPAPHFRSAPLPMISPIQRYPPPPPPGV